MKKTFQWSLKSPYKHPKVQLDSTLSHNPDRFYSSYCQGVIKTTNASGELFFNSILPSHHWPEFLGDASPLFPYRSLWLNSNIITWLMSQNENTFKLLSKTIIELGYNTLILGGLDETYESSFEICLSSLQELIRHLNEFNIKLALNLSTCFRKVNNEIEWVDIHKNILTQLAGVHFILVSGRIPNKSIERENLQLDIEIIVNEIHQIEKLLNREYGLIYYLPCISVSENKPEISLKSLDIELSSNKTILAFSAVAGNPEYVHLPNHPFWNEIRCMQEILNLKLMPVVTFPGLKNPSIPYDLFETFLLRCYRHSFAGIAAYTSEISMKYDLTHCILWVAGQMQRKSLSPSLYIETWFKSSCPEVNYEEFIDLFRQLRLLFFQIHDLSHGYQKEEFQIEELRFIHEALFSQLKLMEIKSNKKLNKKIADSEFLRDFSLRLKDFFISSEQSIMASARSKGFNLNLPKFLNI